MKAFFDTSALIPALVTDSALHPDAFSWLKKAQQGEIEGCLSSHGLAELYVFLTGHGKMNPHTVQNIIDNEILAKLELIALTETEYRTVIEDSSAMNLSGAIVYDLVHSYAARKAAADVILTSNTKDFLRICPLPPPTIITLTSVARS